MKFEMYVKRGLHNWAHIEGVEREPLTITPQDLYHVIETEQLLERLFGLRFHIQSSSPLRIPSTVSLTIKDT